MASSDINSYRDLKVWQGAMTLAEACYGATRSFPREEMFGLTTQIRRSATSVAANIAEGHGRGTPGAFVQFLRIAQGSLKELETLILLAMRVGFMSREQAGTLLDQCVEVGKMVRGLVSSLRKSVTNGSV